MSKKFNKRPFHRDPNSKPKISDKTLATIKEVSRLREDGFSTREIAKIMGISKTTAHIYGSVEKYEAYLNKVQMRQHTCSDEDVDARRQYIRDIYSENIDLFRARQKQWILNNPDKVKQYNKNDYLKHKDKLLAKSKIYHDAHKDELSAKARARHNFNLASAKNFAEQYALEHLPLGTEFVVVSGYRDVNVFTFDNCNNKQLRFVIKVCKKPFALEVK